MSGALILASSSETRQMLLRNAGVLFEAIPARVDEAAMRDAMIAEGAPPRDIADALAEAKAAKLSRRFPDRRVLGCDQVLAFDGTILGKPETRDDAHEQLLALRGRSHSLLSAAVLYHDARPVWRHVATAHLTMRHFSDSYLEDYLDRNWPGVSSSVGGYKLEEEGVRLFARVDGNHFTILGLPLIELLSHLSVTGAIAA
jgi:septum formation protein